MPNLIKLIAAVQKIPALYDKNLFDDYENHERIWDKLALKCGIQNGYEANKMWKDLIKGYIEYLRDGKDFDYGNEMLFVQAHLISVQSDSDELDEDELQRIIDSDSETSSSDPQLPVKRQQQQQIELVNHEAKINRKRLRSTRHHETNCIRTDKTQTNATVDSSTAVESSSIASSNVAGFSSLQLIFLGYAKILQDLPLPVQIKTKHKIAQIMNEAEMSLLEMNDIGDNVGKSAK